jgi:hypothetical protein
VVYTVVRWGSAHEVVRTRSIVLRDGHLEFNAGDVVSPEIEGGAINHVLATVVGELQPSPSLWHRRSHGALVAHDVGGWVALIVNAVVESEVISLEDVDGHVSVLGAEFPEFESMASWLINHPSAEAPDGLVDGDDVGISLTLKRL